MARAALLHLSYVPLLRQQIAVFRSEHFLAQALCFGGKIAGSRVLCVRKSRPPCGNLRHEGRRNPQEKQGFQEVKTYNRTGSGKIVAATAERLQKSRQEKK